MHTGKKALIHPKETPIFKHGTIDTKMLSICKPPFTSQTAGSRAGVNPRADFKIFRHFKMQYEFGGAFWIISECSLRSWFYFFCTCNLKSQLFIWWSRVFGIWKQIWAEAILQVVLEISEKNNVTQSSQVPMPTHHSSANSTPLPPHQFGPTL